MSPKKTILITGCTNGIGLEAAKKLYRQGHRLILVGRSREKSGAAAKSIIEATSVSSDNNTTNSDISTTEMNKIATFGADMSSMESIRKFSNEVKQSALVKQHGIDVVCLNAGMCLPRNSPIEYSVDGYELTVATNHLGPFLLTHEVLPLMNDNGRFVITSSGTHTQVSFASFKGVKKQDGSNEFIDDVSSPRSFETLDGSDFHYFKAYSMSKLCNTAFTMELNRRLEHQGRGMIASCFSPGLIPTTGLFQRNNRFAVMIFGWVVRLFGFVDSVEWGAGALAWMATDNIDGGKFYRGPSGISSKGGSYNEHFKPFTVPDESMDDSSSKALWKWSCLMTKVDDVVT